MKALWRVQKECELKVAWTIHLFLLLNFAHTETIVVWGTIIIKDTFGKLKVFLLWLLKKHFLFAQYLQRQSISTTKLCNDEIMNFYFM